MINVNPRCSYPKNNMMMEILWVTGIFHLDVLSLFPGVPFDCIKDVSASVATKFGLSGAHFV